MVDSVTRIPNITLSSTPPLMPTAGDLWWSPTTGQQSVWFDDGDTTQWVISNWGQGKQGERGIPGPVGPSGPPSGNISYFDSLAALKANGTLVPLAVTRGYYSPTDKGGGPMWQAIAASVVPEDDFMVVRPTFIGVGQPGRYHRIVQSGADVSPLWAGCGMGLIADDTIQFTKVLKYGAAVNASGGDYTIAGINIDGTAAYAKCPGIFSDGTAIFRPVAGSTQSYIFVVTKATPFYFRRLIFLGDIVTDPFVLPKLSRSIWFATVLGDGYGENWEISGCYHEGGINAFVCGGGARNYRCEGNFIKKTWSDAISGPNAMDGAYIDKNMMFDGGVADQSMPSSPSGAIRVGLGGGTQPGSQLSISYNMIKNWSPATVSSPSPQSAIDCFSSLLCAVKVNHNIMVNTPGTIEIKTTSLIPLTVPDDYKGFELDGNQFYDGGGITIFYAGNAGQYPTARKAGKFKITSNFFARSVRPTIGQFSACIRLSAFDQLVFEENVLLDVSGGLTFDGLASSGPAIDWGARDLTIARNTMDTVDSCIGWSGGTIERLTMDHNNLTSEAGTVSLAGSSGTIKGGTIAHNTMRSTASGALNIRDVRGMDISHNLLSGVTSALDGAIGQPQDNVIELNRLKIWLDPLNTPASSVTCPTPGAGLTNGTRIFTVTDANTGKAAQFSFVVAGGVVTGAGTMLSRGTYSTFPATPTVTVDTGIVGGAVFALVAPVPGNASRINGLNNKMQRNTLDMTPVTGAGLSFFNSGVVAVDNSRGFIATDPNGTHVGSPGELIYNSNYGFLGQSSVMKWECLFSNGSAGNTYWRGITGQGTQAPRVVTAAGAVTGTFADSEIAVRKTVGAATAVTLPPAMPFGWAVRVSDAKGDAAANNITTSPAVGANFTGVIGAASNTLNVYVPQGVALGVGQTIAGAGVVGATITAPVSTNVWTISGAVQSVGPVAMTASGGGTFIGVIGASTALAASAITGTIAVGQYLQGAGVVQPSGQAPPLIPTIVSGAGAAWVISVALRAPSVPMTTNGGVGTINGGATDVINANWGSRLYRAMGGNAWQIT